MQIAISANIIGSIIYIRTDHDLETIIENFPYTKEVTKTMRTRAQVRRELPIMDLGLGYLNLQEVLEFFLFVYN